MITHLPKISPVKRKRAVRNEEAKVQAVIDEPRKKQRTLEDYHRDFLGGRNCTRITIPIITLEQIKLASSVLRELANDLDECAHQESSQLGKILVARNLCNDASRRLKGGIAYKGAR